MATVTAISAEGRVRSMIKWYDRIGNRIEMKLYQDADKQEFEWVKGNVIECYRYQDGIVSMKSDDGRIIWCGVSSGDFRKSEDSIGDFISNVDRIRSMSCEELAELFYLLINLEDKIKFCKNKTECEYILDAGKTIPDSMCKKCLVQWLQSEVEE